MIYENIDEFINLNNDHLISFTVSTFNNLNILRNLIQSAINQKINLVLFALDKKIASYISRFYDIDIVLFFIHTNPNENNEDDDKIINYKYGSPEWASIVYDRYFITHRLLKDGRNIVYMDTDVFINRNYLMDIKEKLRDKDIVIQTNGKDCCTGFFAMKSCKKLINFFNRKHMTQKLNCYDFGGDGGPSDQKFFNHYIGSNLSEFNCEFLEINFYPNGKYYYNNYDIINEYCYIIHFNCVRTEYKKILRLLQFNRLLVPLLDYITEYDIDFEPEKNKYYYIQLINNVNNILKNIQKKKLDNEKDNNDDDNNDENNNEDDNNDENNNQDDNDDENNNQDDNDDENNNQDDNDDENNNQDDNDDKNYKNNKIKEIINIDYSSSVFKELADKSELEFDLEKDD